MQLFKNILFSALFIVVLTGCTHYDEVVINGNIPPPDHTIPNTVYDNYVTRTYILVLGREPSDAELTNNVVVLKSGLLNDSSRVVFLNTVFANPDYYYHLYEDNRSNLLRDNDSANIKNLIYVLNIGLMDTALSQAWPIYQYELNRLNQLDSAKTEFVNGIIDIKEVQRRMVNNYFYDQINMNSQNFVLAVFQQLVNRVPTQNELQGGVSMVDGNNASVLLQSGASKDDFLHIILTSDDYYEGQVLQLYNKFLLRTATSQEMTKATSIYRNTGDYVKVQIEILKSDDFVPL